MDAKGAEELARRLDARHGERADVRPEPLKTADAAPIFHWLGIEPPRIADADDEAIDVSRRRRRR
jgi:hypothetical protein